MLTSDFMGRQSVRPAAVAGSWYPGDADGLRREVRSYLDAAVAPPGGRVVAIVAPHAGLMYSGTAAACSYRAVADSAYDAVVPGPTVRSAAHTLFWKSVPRRSTSMPSSASARPAK